MRAIEVESLEKSYGSLKAVGGISFSVDEGEVFSLLGPNGAGKTTTIEILEGLRDADSGKRRVLGFDPWKQGYELHRKIGVIPQGFKFFLYPTPREAVRYYSALFGVKADVDKLLQRVLLTESADTYFLKLSGGQKQKLGMALSLVNDPELVFLDEPTTGLDPAARRAVWEVIRGLRKEGRTVLLTTHYLQEAEELADRVAIMDHGKIITSGTPGEIIARHGSGDRLTIRADEKLGAYLREKAGLAAEFDGHGRVSVRLKTKNDALSALKAIEESGLDWSDLSTRRDSLEDIFIRMVGENPDDQGNGRHPPG
ncbi:MAG: ABC transporter ATP-binding protein [Thaumarchaeota archaeon]|nr:ABC transporter ATP-binding protein [Nitrososphaerota archaeon]